MTQDPERLAEKLEISGDWLIWHDPLPINSRKADWCFVHKDFTRDNEDIRIGREESREMCLQTIDFIEDMEAQSREEATQDQVDKLMKRFWEIALVHDLARALKNVIDDPTGRGFKHKESMAIARAILPVIRAHLEPTSEMVDAARKKGQDEGFASAVSWLRDRSAQKPAAYLALEADMLANGLENSRKAYVSLSQEPSHGE